MAGGGQFNNPYQQPGGAYGQAIGQGRMRQNMRGMNPNQPILQRPIGTMGPGAGMAPTQTGLGAQGTLVPPNMGMAPMPNQIGAFQPGGAMHDLMRSQIGAMNPGAGMAPPPTFGFNQQQNPYMDYMKQLYSGQQNQQQMPRTGGGMMPPPRQIGTMGPGAGLASALGIAGLPRG